MFRFGPSQRFEHRCRLVEADPPGRIPKKNRLAGSSPSHERLPAVRRIDGDDRVNGLSPEPFAVTAEGRSATLGLRTRRAILALEP